MSDSRAPRVFLSYAWEDEDYRAWVRQLATRLRQDGIDARLDQWHAGAGSPAAFMEGEIERADRIVVICSPAYRAKVRDADAGGRTTGAAWEATLIREGLLGDLLERDKIVVAIGRGPAREVVPLSLRSFWIDLSTPATFEAAYAQLIVRISSSGETAPPLGAPATSGGATRPSKPPSTAAPATLAREAAMPLPPSFPHSHPFQRGFTGRSDARDDLSAWLASSSRQVLVLEGLGGMGKSTLAWVWLNEDVLGRQMTGDPARVPADRSAGPEPPRPEGVIWWSFYEPDASVPELFAHIAAYLGTAPVESTSAGHAVSTAVELLRAHAILLVLDGFERQLGDYLGDRTAAAAGDGGGARKGTRACANPWLSRFITDLASMPMSSRVLITSRSIPAELNDLAFAEVKRLSGLADEHAATFLRQQGLQGTTEELQDASRRWEGHPLSLRLLAGALVNDPDYRGDVRRAHEIKLTQIRGESDSDRDLRNLANVLWFAYDRLNKRQQAILSQIAGLRFPRPLEDIAAVVGGGTPPVKVAVQSLCDRGLLLYKAESATYDLHPSVRGYAYDRLRDKEGTHARMRAYFKTPAGESSRRTPQSAADLRDRIELFHHTVGAGRDGQALDLLLDLHAQLYYQFGAYSTCLELLEAFVVSEPSSDDGAPQLRLRRWRDRGWALVALGNAYGRLGRSQRARACLREAARSYEQHRAHEHLSIALVSLATIEIKMGLLSAADETLQRQLALTPLAGGELMTSRAHMERARLLAYTGALGDAERELDAAVAAYERHDIAQAVAVYRALGRLANGDAQAARAAAIEAVAVGREFEATDGSPEPLTVWAESLVAVADVNLIPPGAPIRDERLAVARQRLGEALRRCEALNMQELQPLILLALSRAHLRGGELVEARLRASEVLGIASRCHYRLDASEAHVFLARCALAAGDAVAAGDCAGQAIELAGAPPWRFEAVARAAAEVRARLSSPDAVSSGVELETSP